MEGPEIKAVEAVIDNGSFGTRTLRFETGRLAQQADGAVAAYLDDDSMVLSTTTAGSSPKENYDFFPLTVDVEEKMYAAGKIPGSFFRREGRPSTDAILACRIIDRPLRPLFPHTLRNEVQVVETVLSVNPEDSYDMIALNAASASTLISGLPFEGPVSGVRLALGDGQGLIEVLVGDLVDAGVQRVRVLREKLEVLGGLGGQIPELVLRLADDLDEGLGRFDAPGHNLLVGLGLSLVVDEMPGVLAGSRLDHGDRDVTVLHDASGHDELEHRAVALAPRRERDP